MVAILKRAQKAPPPRVAEKYEQAGLRLLVALCRELQRELAETGHQNRYRYNVNLLPEVLAEILAKAINNEKTNYFFNSCSTFFINCICPSLLCKRSRD